MKQIVFGFVGNVLDNRGRGKSRWSRWRPTIDVCRHQHFRIDQLELLYFPADLSLVMEIQQDLALIAPQITVNPIPVDIQDPWDFEEVYMTLLDIAQHYPFDLDQAHYGIHMTTGTHTVQICWYLLAEARFFPAKLIQIAPNKSGADPEMCIFEDQDNPIKINPLGAINIVDLNLTKYDALFSRFQQYTDKATQFLKAGIATKNQAYNHLIEEIEKISIRSKAPVLIEGPTGAGKSFLAQRIYQLKKNTHQLNGKFIEVNCATLRSDSAMSTLFGHVRGAFTGADKDRTGLLKAADGGLLFLDEIGELGLDEQAMILKALEEKKFLPFGSDTEIHSDFQLITGTNRDLHYEVKHKRFREDLFARINLWTYCLPGLAERKEDIEPNIEYELIRYAQNHGHMPRFNQEAKKLYLDFATSKAALWPGNFRELTASITRMATLCQEGIIDKTEVFNEIARLQKTWQPEYTPTIKHPLIPDALDLFEQIQLEKILEICSQSISLSEAGRKLFAVSRTQKKTPNDADRLKKYLGKYNIDWEMIQKSS